MLLGQRKGPVLIQVGRQRERVVLLLYVREKHFASTIINFVETYCYLIEKCYQEHELHDTRFSHYIDSEAQSKIGFVIMS